MIKKSELANKLREVDRPDLLPKIFEVLHDEENEDLTADGIIKKFLKLFPDKKIIEDIIVPDDIEF